MNQTQSTHTHTLSCFSGRWVQLNLALECFGWRCKSEIPRCLTKMNFQLQTSDWVWLKRPPTILIVEVKPSFSLIFRIKTAMNWEATSSCWSHIPSYCIEYPLQNPMEYPGKSYDSIPYNTHDVLRKIFHETPHCILQPPK